MDNTDDILYTVEAAAARLGKSTKTIRRMISRGDLSAVQVKGVHGQEWRVHLPAVDTTVDPRQALESIPPRLSELSELSELTNSTISTISTSPDLDRLITSLDALTAELRLARESRTRPAWWKRVFTRFSNWS